MTASGDLSKSREDHRFDNSFEVTIYGDIAANDGFVPTDLCSAAQFISNVPKYIDSANDGKGKPLMYTLLPLSTLTSLLKVQIARHVTIRELSSECAVQAFDEINRVRQELNDHRTLLQDHRIYFSPSQIRLAGDRILEARTIETKLQASYTTTLKQVRAETSEESALWKVLDDFNKAGSAIHRLANIESRPSKEKIQLVTSLLAKGAKYIGYNGESLDLELGTSPNEDFHVFKRLDGTPPRRRTLRFCINCLLIKPTKAASSLGTTARLKNISRRPEFPFTAMRSWLPRTY